MLYIPIQKQLHSSIAINMSCANRLSYYHQYNACGQTRLALLISLDFRSAREWAFRGASILSADVRGETRTFPDNRHLSRNPALGPAVLYREAFKQH